MRKKLCSLLTAMCLIFTFAVPSFAEDSHVAVTNIKDVPTTATAETDLTLTGTVEPDNATNKTIVWSVTDAGTTGATINGTTLKTNAAGTTKVTATITNGKTTTENYTQEFSITVNAKAKVKLATPTATPAAGAVSANTTVALSCTTSDAKIYYTIDNSSPTSASNLYSSPITIDVAKTIKAIAIKDGMDNSDVLTSAYTIKTTTPPIDTDKKPITVEQKDNGRTITSHTTAAAGQQVIITTRPNSGYEVDKVSIYDTVGNKEIAQSTTFTMPTPAVALKVTVTYKKKPNTTENKQDNINNAVNDIPTLSVIGNQALIEQVNNAVKDLIKAGNEAQALANNASFMSNISNIEARYKEAQSITVGQAPNGIRSFSGAALSATQNSTINLTATATTSNNLVKDNDINNRLTRERVLDTKQIDFALTSNNSTLTVKAPIKIIADIPSGWSTVRVFHKNGNALELVPSTTNGTQIQFTATGFSTYVFAKVQSTGSNNGNSGGSSGGGHHGSGSGNGGGSSSNKKPLKPTTTTTTTTSTITPITTTPTKEVSSAIKNAKAKGNKSVSIVLNNISTVSSNVFADIAAQAKKSGLTAMVISDSMKNKAVNVRMSISAADAAKLGKDINLNAKIGNPTVEKHFAKYYKNKVAVVEMSQKGTFGTPVAVSAKVSLKGMDSSKLCFYTYSLATNSYHEIPQTSSFVDTNGYLHFTTDIGNTLVVSQGALVRR